MLIRVWLETQISAYLGEGLFDSLGLVARKCFHLKLISDLIFLQMFPQFLVYNMIELHTL